MLFFGKKDPEQAEPKPRSTLGMLFNPEIGSSVRPLGEALGMFVQIIAMIFAANGLFPRNHPVLLTGKGQLSLSEVIGTAWRGLSFTYEGAPRVILFFAVIGCLVFSALAVATFVLMLFVGKAHAQVQAPVTNGCGSTMFDPCNATTDIAQNWINYIFFGQPMNNYTSQSGSAISQPTNIQGALQSVFAFYSNAMLVCAALIVLYHLVHIVVGTAHHGEVMGKHHDKIWAPLRLVFAIGLLVPIASTTGTGTSQITLGLNTGQYIIIKIAEWGSGMADQAWSIFVTRLAQEQNTYVPPPSPYTRDIVESIVLMDACMHAFNSLLTQTAPGGTPNTGEKVTLKPAVPIAGGTANKYVYGNSNADNLEICGSYTIPIAPPNASQTTTSIINTYTSAIGAIQSGDTSVVQNIEYFYPDQSCNPPGGANGQAPAGCTISPGSTLPYTTAFETLVTNFQTSLNTGVSTATNNMNQSLNDIATEWAGQGWITAGAWFNTIAATQTGLSSAVQDGAPTMHLPFISDSNSAQTSPALRAISIYPKVNAALYNFRVWLRRGNQAGSAQTQASATSTQQMADAGADFSRDSGGEGNHMLDKLFALIDWVASMNGVWNTNIQNGSSTVNVGSTSLPTPNLDSLPNQAGTFSLGVQFTSANPLAEMAQFGHANINTAYVLYDWLILAELGAGVGKDAQGALNFIPIPRFASGLMGFATSKGGEVAGAIGGLLGVLVLVFFAAGFMMAFLLPLIPFGRFFFTSLTWIVMLLEAVVCAPLIALAHLNPEGEGLPGPQARKTYFLIFNIFLRPTLMIFGLICGLLVFFVAVSAMNQLYGIAVVGTGGMSHGHLTLSRLTYSIVYVVILYACANSCFKLIQVFPDNAMKWIGSEAVPGTPMGDVEHINQALSLVTTYGEQQLIQQTSGAARQAGGAVGAALLPGALPSQEQTDIKGNLEKLAKPLPHPPGPR